MAEILILFILLVLWALLCGVGLLFFGLFGFSRCSAEDYLNSFWVGWCFLLFILQLWHLFFPVDRFIVVIIVLAGVFGLFRARRGKPKILKIIPGFGWVLFFLILLMLFPVANGALLPSGSYDDGGLYGIQTMRWINRYPVVPGLANLHGRLAFNSTYFLYTAFLNAIHENFYRLANGLLYLGFLFQAGLGILRIVRSRDAVRLEWIFSALLVCPLLILDQGINFSFLSSDIPVYFLGMLTAIQLLSLLGSRGCDDDICTRRKSFYIFSFCLAGITLKLSFFAMGLTASVIAGFLTNQKKGIFVPTSILALIVILLWVARSVIMSGYPFYPLPVFLFPVEWRVPLASVKVQIASIVSFARMPGVLNWSKTLADYGWLKFWWAQRCTFSVIAMLLPLSLAVLGLLGIFCARCSNARPVLGRKVYLFLLPALINLIYWFFSAPAVRFCGATFFMLGMGCLAAGIYELTRGKKFFGTNIIITVYLLFCLTIFYSLPILKKSTGLLGFYEELKPAVFEFAGASGLKVYVPIKNNRCFNCNLPCTPYFHPGLSLRSPDVFKDGFKMVPYDEKDKTVGVPQEGVRR